MGKSRMSPSRPSKLDHLTRTTTTPILTPRSHPMTKTMSPTKNHLQNDSLPYEIWFLQLHDPTSPTRSRQLQVGSSQVLCSVARPCGLHEPNGRMKRLYCISTCVLMEGRKAAYQEGMISRL